MSLYTCGDRQSVDLGLAIPIPDTTYLYFMYRQPMDMVLQDPMLAMHHHNVHNWITAMFLFYAQVSSLVLRFNSRLKTPLSWLCISSATWTALYMEVWPSLHMKKKNTLHIHPWCIGTITKVCDAKPKAEYKPKAEAISIGRGKRQSIVHVQTK